MSAADTFVGMVEGARGTFVFGNGIDAVGGEVVDVGADYVRFARDEMNRLGERDMLLIPLASVVYFRYEDED